MVLTDKIQHVFTSSFLKLSRNKRNLPNIAIDKAFKSKYPYTTFARWNQVDVFMWEVNFRIRAKHFSALFDSEGNWLETVTEMTLDDAPKQVQKSFNEKYGPEGLQQIQHVETSNTDIFEIQWSNGVFVWKLLYNISGKIVGKLIV